MKKVLFASTAAAAMAFGGMASAQGITVFGDARLGLVYNQDRVIVTNELVEESREIFGSSRVRFGVRMTGTTNAGVTFGGEIRADNSGNATSLTPTNNAAGTAFISGAFGTLTFGDTNGADRFRVGVAAPVGYTELNNYEIIPFLTNARTDGSAVFAATGLDSVAPNLRAAYGAIGLRPTIRYDYTIAGFGVSASTDGNLGDLALGVSYAADLGGGSVTGALGYARVDTSNADTAVNDSDSVDQFSASLRANFNGITGGIYYANIDSSEVETLAVEVGGAFGDIGVRAFYHTTLSLPAGADNVDAFGLGASYDLGGGAVLRGGVVSDFEENIQADFGINLSF